MFSEATKRRIRTEEAYRMSAGRKLAARSAVFPRSRIWAMLNSSFVLWLLSTVFVAGITAAYARYQDQIAAERQRTSQIQKLDAEVGNRISQALARLSLDMAKARQGVPTAPQSVYFTAAKYLNNGWARDILSTADFSIYPEFRTRTFRSLVTELRTLVEPDARHHLDYVLARYEDLADLGYLEETASATLTAVPDDRGLHATTKASVLLRDQMLKARWNDTVGGHERKR